jgi:hypothetical protein
MPCLVLGDGYRRNGCLSGVNTLLAQVSDKEGQNRGGSFVVSHAQHPAGLDTRTRATRASWSEGRGMCLPKPTLLMSHAPSVA